MSETKVVVASSVTRRRVDFLRALLVLIGKVSNPRPLDLKIEEDLKS